ncbi:hypothetical protein KEF85_00505 [Methylomonas paludis]|uniref:Uncharacterized protein n=1 Tax=Methylomonas paludis TaxID=1173101 RepID=A0A975RA99_9GAMM|nr:hypothetical protein [Methylomonas paludis]QWF71016.1 hypothetical protein KEF85_00505 [Methylomonas paludis]
MPNNPTQKPAKYDKLIILAVLIAAAVAVTLISLNTLVKPDELTWTPWAFYEWMINYQAGFVRRGLVGELVQRFYFNHEAQALNYLAFFSGILFIGFSIQQILINPQVRQTALLYSFAPTGFFWIAVANEYYFRKEILFYLAIFLVSALYRSWYSRRSKWLAILVLGLIILFSSVLPFVHEAYPFFCGLIFVSIIQKIITANYGKAKASLAIQVFIAANLLMFVFMSINKGNVLISQQIWASLSVDARHFSNNNQISGGIASIGWSLLGGVALPVHAILSGMGSYYLFPLLLVYLITGYIYASLAEQPLFVAYTKPVFISNFVLVFVGFLPLFMLGWDWGRWIVGIFVVLSALIYSNLLIELPQQTLIAVTGFLQKRLKAIFLIAILLISLVTKTPECCISGSGATLWDNKLVTLLIKTLKNSGQH